MCYTVVLQYMFGALRDCVPRMAAVRHMATPKELTDAYDREIYGYFKEVCQKVFCCIFIHAVIHFANSNSFDSFFTQNLLSPLCQAIETDLRLQIHTHLQLDDRNPFKVGMRDLSHLLRVRPIRLFDRLINIKGKYDYINLKYF